MSLTRPAIQHITFRLGTPQQHGEHHFSDHTWLMLWKSEIRLVDTHNKIIATLRFRSFAAAAEAWPVLCALPSAAARIAAQEVR